MISNKEKELNKLGLQKLSDPKIGKGSTYLVSGKHGTGKTYFIEKYLLKNILEGKKTEKINPLTRENYNYSLNKVRKVSFTGEHFNEQKEVIEKLKGFKPWNIIFDATLKSLIPLETMIIALVLGIWGALGTFNLLYIAAILAPILIWLTVLLIRLIITFFKFGVKKVIIVEDLNRLVVNAKFSSMNLINKLSEDKSFRNKHIIFESYFTANEEERMLDPRFINYYVLVSNNFIRLRNIVIEGMIDYIPVKEQTDIINNVIKVYDNKEQYYITRSSISFDNINLNTLVDFILFRFNSNVRKAENCFRNSINSYLNNESEYNELNISWIKYTFLTEAVKWLHDEFNMVTRDSSLSDKENQIQNIGLDNIFSFFGLPSNKLKNLDENEFRSQYGIRVSNNEEYSDIDIHKFIDSNSYFRKYNICFKGTITGTDERVTLLDSIDQFNIDSNIVKTVFELSEKR